jgi:hypothetical protein
MRTVLRDFVVRVPKVVVVSHYLQHLINFGIIVDEHFDPTSEDNRIELRKETQKSIHILFPHFIDILTTNENGYLLSVSRKLTPEEEEEAEKLMRSFKSKFPYEYRFETDDFEVLIIPPFR